MFAWICCLWLGGGWYLAYSVILYTAFFMVERHARLLYRQMRKTLLVFAAQACILYFINLASLHIEGPLSFIGTYLRLVLSLYVSQFTGIILIPRRIGGKQGSKASRILSFTWLDSFFLCLFLFISLHLSGEETSKYGEIASQSLQAVFVGISFILRNNGLSQREHIHEITEEVQQLNRLLTVAHDQVLTALALSLEKRDAYTLGHSERVVYYANQIAKELSLSQEERNLIHLGGLLHDLGKIGIPDSILHKEGKLTESEYLIMKQHPVIGEELLRRVYDYFPSLGYQKMKVIFDIVLYHHERPDGKGYPTGLIEEQIPIHAKILAVADAYDAMTSNRSYRPAMSEERAIEILLGGAGTQFWTPAVNAFIKLRSNERWNERTS